MPGMPTGGAGGAGGMMAMLQKLLSGGGGDIAGLASQAALKGPPPQIGPGPGGVIAPGAFAGAMDPTVGAIPGGVGSPMMAAMPRALPMPNAAPPGMMNPTLNAQQANAIAQMGQQPPMHFPGTASFARPGQIGMTAAPGAQGGQLAPHRTLGQLIG